MIAGLVVNKNLKKGAKVHEKVSAGGRRQLFVPTRSEMIEEDSFSFYTGGGGGGSGDPTQTLITKMRQSALSPHIMTSEIQDSVV